MCNPSEQGWKLEYKQCSLRSYFASHSCCPVTQVLSLAVDSDIVYAAIKGLWGTIRPGTQT